MIYHLVIALIETTIFCKIYSPVSALTPARRRDSQSKLLTARRGRLGATAVETNGAYYSHRAPTPIFHVLA